MRHRQTQVQLNLYIIQGDSKIWIHPIKFVIDIDRKMQLCTPFMEIKVQYLVTATTLLMLLITHNVV